tara:strand:+ start:359 stop:1201 length:843 start_codon:yes stop_codon:yes gene_type:complete
MDKYDDEVSTPKWFWLAVAFIITSWLLFPIILNMFNWESSEKGSFGDTYGALNTLFSGFAFLGVIYAILLQRKELKLQREELRDTREELRGSKEAQQALQKTQEIQRFENTFFNLLNLYDHLVKSIEIGGGNNIRVGKKAFEWIASMITNGGPFGYNEIPTMKSYMDNYCQQYDSYPSQLAHYYRTLYRIFFYINNSELEQIDKQKYAKIIRAQLSNDEIILLFFNGQTELGAKFSQYIEKYELLNNGDFSFLPREYKHIILQAYSKQAYGPSGQNQTIL